MDQKVRFILEYLSNDSGKPITLNQISEMVNLSYGYVSDLFKKETGISFSKYLKKIRMEKAQKLLKSSFKSIKEISYLIGYKHFSSFCEEFKKIMGVSPSTYRKTLDAYKDSHNKKVI